MNMAQLNWTEAPANVDGVITRGFAIERAGASIPGVLWQPATQSAAQPLVLMGHGGSGHKRNARMSMLGKLFAGDMAGARPPSTARCTAIVDRSPNRDTRCIARCGSARMSLTA